MHFKIFVIVLVLPFLVKGKDAKLINTPDEDVLDREVPEQDGEEKALMMESENDKRTLGGSRRHTHKSFKELSLELAKLYILEETARKSKAITSSLQDEVNENSEDKCSKIKKVGEPIVHHHSGYTQGAWMRDPLGLLGAEKIWYINGHTSRNKVLEFDSMDHFKGGEIAKTYTLPYDFDGTGHVVYGRYLYYNRKGTNKIVQYDLVTEKVTRQASPNTNIVSRKYYYGWSTANTIDLSVDESGLWALYSYSRYSGKLCASQIEALTLNALHTYCGVSSEAMGSMGNAFVACGIVYSIDSYNSATTTINYAYDTTTRSGTNPGIRFVNKFRYNSMVTYNPREKVLYAWDNKRQITYPLEFED